MNVSERISKIKNWILEYCNSTPSKPDYLVVGVSGGIDSAVTSAICGLTGMKTIALSMLLLEIDPVLRISNEARVQSTSVEGRLPRVLPPSINKSIWNTQNCWPISWKWSSRSSNRRHSNHHWFLSCETSRTTLLNWRLDLRWWHS